MSNHRRIPKTPWDVAVDHKGNGEMILRLPKGEPGWCDEDENGPRLSVNVIDCGLDYHDINCFETCFHIDALFPELSLAVVTTFCVGGFLSNRIVKQSKDMQQRLQTFVVQQREILILTAVLFK